MKMFTRNMIMIIFLLTILTNIECCIRLIEGWVKLPLEERTKRADIVLTAKILYISPIPGQLLFYAATFEVLNVLKGWEVLRNLHKRHSKAILSLDPKIIVTAKGFADARFCFSNVRAGQSYALFLGYNRQNLDVVAKYDDVFGAADELFRRTERNILKSLGWEDWTHWTKCSRSCGTGIQERTRKCVFDKKCHGPSVQRKECNTYSCKNSIDILSFIVNYESNILTPWRRNNAGKTNVIERVESPAPTYLLFPDEFPRGSVLHISFKGPVKDTQFLYSIYNANNNMEFGIKITPYNLYFVYDKKIDEAVSIKRAKIFTSEFNEDIWYSLALLLMNDQIKLVVNCGEMFTADLDKNLFNDFDIYGRMYLGTDSEGYISTSKVEISSITLSTDRKSLTQQCGKILLDENIENSSKTTANQIGSGEDAGVLVNGPDDSESGDVDEEYGSGEMQSCNCLNGGVCKRSGLCTCPQGWSGDKCETPLCYNKCLNGGTCSKPHTCTCRNGTSGKYCQFTECQSPCQNEGICIGPNKCKCKPGFDGAQCETEKCSKVCLNGGTCFNNKQCKCIKGFKGDSCQFPESCKRYITKLVSYMKPATVYTHVDYLIPCNKNSAKMCKISRVKYQTVNQINYRPEYACVA